MKISKISRKSLVIYLTVFFIMLLFEAPRINPLLEREGAEYPILLQTKQILQDIGEKSDIYAFSTRLHDEFAYTANHSLFSEPKQIGPAAAQWLAGLFAPLQNFLRTLPVQIQPEKNTPPSPVQAENTAPQQNTASSTAEEQEAYLSAAGQYPVQEQLLTFDENGYPFSPERVRNAQTQNGIACYDTLLPDYGIKKTVLLIGDSMMMEGLGPTLHHRLRKRDNLDVYREGKYSSGLSRPDFYDWPTNLAAMLDKYRPDLLIMSLGANDTQDIVIDKKRYFIDTKPWAEVYLQRCKEFISLADNGKRHIVWVSLPVMGKEPYFTRTRLISKLQEEASKSVSSAEFVNIEHLLTENGKYTTFYKDENNQSIRLRSQDLVHVSTAGGEILTDYVLPAVDRHLSALYAQDVPASCPPVPGMANRVTFTSALRKKTTEYYIWLPQTETQADSQPQFSPQQPLDIQKTIAQRLNGQKYPVLYLLHGAEGSGKDFADRMGKSLQKIADEHKTLIVAPSCEPYGWYVNSPYAADSQIADYITKELVPHIDSLYPTNGKRAIAGISMGGHGAMLIGFQNKNLFGSMASISGVLDIREHKNNWKIKELLGIYEENTELWDDNSVYATIGKKWPATSPGKIFAVTGSEDTLVLAENRKAMELFHKRGFSVEYAEEKGGHTWEFWNGHIPQILQKQAAYLNSLQ